MLGRGALLARDIWTILKIINKIWTMLKNEIKLRITYMLETKIKIWYWAIILIEIFLAYIQGAFTRVQVLSMKKSEVPLSKWIYPPSMELKLGLQGWDQCESLGPRREEFYRVRSGMDCMLLRTSILNDVKKWNQIVGYIYICWRQKNKNLVLSTCIDRENFWLITKGAFSRSKS